MKVQVPFYRLNLADMYNNKMGRVDVVAKAWLNVSVLFTLFYFLNSNY